MSELTFRALTRADVPAVAAMVQRCDATYAEWAKDWDPPTIQTETEDWETELARTGAWTHGAFEARGAVVGAVAFRAAEDPDLGPIPGVAHVSAVFTDPGHWGRGIAAALLALAEAEMRSRDYGIARLWTPRGAAARGFYEHQGWSFDGRERFSERFGLELVGYEKRLTTSA